jgi:hypothetical protein
LDALADQLDCAAASIELTLREFAVAADASTCESDVVEGRGARQVRNDERGLRGHVPRPAVALPRPDLALLGSLGDGRQSEDHFPDHGVPDDLVSRPDLLSVEYDARAQQLVVPRRRIPITGARGALNRYQKAIASTASHLCRLSEAVQTQCQVDHVFPLVDGEHGRADPRPSQALNRHCTPITVPDL